MGIIASILGLLSSAPALLDAGREIVGAITGEDVSKDATPQDIASRVEKLPADQQSQVLMALVNAKVQMQTLDTQRFVSMNDGDAEKMRATARPQIALQAMGVVTLFGRAASVMFIATVAEWLARLVFEAAGWKFPTTSLWGLMAQASPAAEMIWAPLIASFWACVAIIKTYMGCRERDKCHEYEMQAGGPLKSADATIAAAGGAIANAIKIWKGVTK